MTAIPPDVNFASERLARIGRPYVHLLAVEPSLTYEVSWFLAGRDLVTRVLRGLQMQTVDGLFNEAVAALQIPYYFGYNWAAFDECLADLRWLAGSGYVLLITDALHLLANENPVEFRTLMTIVTKAGDEYAQPIALGELWDRPAYPFHVVLQERPANVSLLRKRLEVTGATFTILNRAGP